MTANKVPGTNYIPGIKTTEPANPFGRVLLFACSAAQELGGEIARHLGIQPGRYTRDVFPNENIFIRLNESVRGQDVYLVQTMSAPVHDNIFEMLIMIDTLKRDSAGRVNLVIPYLPYGRSDKKDQPRVGIAARMLANIIEVAGADRYITIDLHAGQIQGFFNIPGDALTAFILLSDYVLDKNIDNLAVVSTDLGFAKKGRNWAEKLGTPLVIIEKRRTGNDARSEALSLIGDVRDKNVLLVDDEVLTGGIGRQRGQSRPAGRRARCLPGVHARLSRRERHRKARLAQPEGNHHHQHTARSAGKAPAEHDGTLGGSPARRGHPARA